MVAPPLQMLMILIFLKSAEGQMVQKYVSLT